MELESRWPYFGLAELLGQAGPYNRKETDLQAGCHSQDPTGKTFLLPRAHIVRETHCDRPSCTRRNVLLKCSPAAPTTEKQALAWMCP